MGYSYITETLEQPNDSNPIIPILNSKYYHDYLPIKTTVPTGKPPPEKCIF